MIKYNNNTIQKFSHLKYYSRRNGKTVFCEITNEVGVFNFATSDEEKEPKNYGILYLNKELIEQEERFHNIIFENEKQIQDLSLENNIY